MMVKTKPTGVGSFKPGSCDEWEMAPFNLRKAFDRKVECVA